MNMIMMWKKLCEFHPVCRTINRTMKGKTRKELKLKFYEVSTPILLHNSKN